MKNRLVRLALAVMGGLAAMAGGIWLLSRMIEEPLVLYQGQSLPQWVEQMHDPDPNVSQKARIMVNTLVIPQLTRAMFSDTNDSRLRVELISVLRGLPGISISFTPAEGRRAGATLQLGEIGPAASTAIPDLIRALKGKDDAIRGPAALALGKIRSEPELIIPLLISCLDDGDVNADASQALGEFGPQSKAAVPKLVELLKVRDKELHAATVGALRKIDPDAAARAGVN